MKISRRVGQSGLILALACAAAGIAAAPALAANYGNSVHNCYGIYWTRDWNQDCTSAGAKYAGYYKTTADCTAPQAIDESREVYRPKGNRDSKDGEDCNFGINRIHTVYWS